MSDLPLELPETPEFVDLTVYRFFQEGTTNALRHGQPGRVTISLEVQESAEGLLLNCVLADDGVGVTDNFNEGRGLTAMRDRINAVGGDLKIVTMQADGLKLVSEIPLLPSLDDTTELSVAS